MRKLTISTANSRKSTSWIKEEVTWHEFIDRLKNPVRGAETLDEYLKLPKSKQDDLKDVGGFVGGELRDGRRKSSNVIKRDLITLDLDNIETNMTADILKRIEALGCAYVVYSTRKHSKYKPRLRVIIPTDRSMTPDEYEPVTRKIADIIGINLCDPTTFEASRLMYFPSCSKDSEYVYAPSAKGFVSADSILGMYDNWKDISEWPRIFDENINEKRLVAKQEDPTSKKGVIGAFCRTYNVIEAIDRFIPKMYEPSDMEDRYTFLGGSTTGGAIVYEDGNFLYSHHATDPISGRLCNAFDLIRIHKFGDLDNEAREGTPVIKLPSTIEMRKLAIADERVATLLHKERIEDSGLNKVVDFPSENIVDDDISWIKQLKLDGNGQIKKTIDNILVILRNDSEVKGKFALDEFSNKGCVLGSVPWDTCEEMRYWKDVDNAGISHFLETKHGITGQSKVEQALLLISHENKFNSVRRYLEGLKWDGLKRVDTLFIDYLGADDNIFTREATRKILVAAVSRAYEKEVKFDSMLVIVGRPNVGKSLILKRLGKEWFNESLTTFEGKEALEVIQGSWIIEVAEIDQIPKYKKLSLKGFISKQEDIFRVAYGKNTEKFPRKCVLFGTANTTDFIDDPMGSRKQWIVSAWGERKKVIDYMTDEEVNQIWAEVVDYYKVGEPLFLSPEAQKISEVQYKNHSEIDERQWMIEDFLDKKITTDWYEKSLSDKLIFLNDGFQKEGIELVARDKICASEIWTECYGLPASRLSKIDSKEINDILKNLEGWEEKSLVRFGSKRHRGFIRS